MNTIPKDLEEIAMIREANLTDLPFIFPSWLKSLYYGVGGIEEDKLNFYRMIPKEIFFPKYRTVLEALLVKPNVRSQVVCLKNAEDVILAYSVTEQARLHFVYTKAAWRKLGLARALLPEPFQEFSHLTALGKLLWLKKFPEVQFNPFL